MDNLSVSFDLCLFFISLTLGFRFLDHETHAPYNTHTLPVGLHLLLEPFPLLESLSCSQSINYPRLPKFTITFDIRLLVVSKLSCSW